MIPREGLFAQLFRRILWKLVKIVLFMLLLKLTLNLLSSQWKPRGTYWGKGLRKPLSFFPSTLIDAFLLKLIQFSPSFIPSRPGSTTLRTTEAWWRTSGCGFRCRWQMRLTPRVNHEYPMRCRGKTRCGGPEPDVGAMRPIKRGVPDDRPCQSSPCSS